MDHGAASGSRRQRAPPLEQLQLDALIGTGGFGQVFACSRRGSGEERQGRVSPLRPSRCLRPRPRRIAERRRWALKCVPLNTGRATIDAVRREVAVLRLASEHRCVASLFWAVETPAMAFLCVELCPGGDLYALIERGQVHRAVVKPLLVEVASALNFLHRNRIVFHDIKPENVALSRTGHARLLDFGLAVRLTNDDANPNTGRLEVHCTAGSFQYAAPEMLRRERHGFEVDWWSFGMLAFELLSGSLPFDADDADLYCLQICTQAIEVPPNVSVDASADAFLRGLLERRPDRRLGFRYESFKSELLGHDFLRDVNLAVIADEAVPLAMSMHPCMRARARAASV